MIKILISNSFDPKYNLAVEEYLTFQYNSDYPIFFLWRNQNTIVIGRNQNTLAEINLDVVTSDKVNVVRRNTGGGAVFQDLGNICYSMIIKKEQNKSDFKDLLQPIIDYLNKFGLNAEFIGRNDLKINDLKISGNARLEEKNKILQHGTLLFDVDLTKINKYLFVDEAKIIHQKVKSKISNVTNIKNELISNGINIDINDFMSQLISYYTKNNKTEQIIFSKEEIDSINSLVETKYNNWDWNYGKHLSFEASRKKYIEGKGLLEIKLNVEESYIKNIKFYGDFLGYLGTEKLEKKLENIKLVKENLINILESENLKEIFGDKFTFKDIIDLIFE